MRGPTNRRAVPAVRPRGARTAVLRQLRSRGHAASRTSRARGDPPVPFPPPRERDPLPDWPVIRCPADVYGARGALDLRRPVAAGRRTVRLWWWPDRPRCRCGSPRRRPNSSARPTADAPPISNPSRPTPASRPAAASSRCPTPARARRTTPPSSRTAWCWTFSPGTAEPCGCSVNPPNGQTPRQIADDLIREQLPGRHVPPTRSPTPSSATNSATAKSPTTTRPTPSATTDAQPRV